MTPFEWFIVALIVAVILWRVVRFFVLAAVVVKEEQIALEKDKRMGESLGIPAEVFTRRRRGNQ